jgi:ABC-type amino acid transport substrate-binding protein
VGVRYEIRKYGTIGQLLEAIENRKLDVILALAGTEGREITLDLSHSYYRSGVAIAVSEDHAGRGWIGFTGRLEVSMIFYAIGLLILLWLLAGVTVLLFERRRNREMFGGGPFKGLGHAVWWAAVTMTTVGYGDKAPKTVGGRIVAIVWMLASIFLISSFTAWISASLTAEKLAGQVRGHHDLPHVRVGSMAQSGTMEWLAKRGVVPVPFSTEREGLQAVVDDKIDAFAYDELVLKYIVKTDFPGLIQELAGTFDHYYICMAMPDGSPLREPINRALFKIMDHDDWEKLVARYIGNSS